MGIFVDFKATYSNRFFAILLINQTPASPHETLTWVNQYQIIPHKSASWFGAQISGDHKSVIAQFDAKAHLRNCL